MDEIEDSGYAHNPEGPHVLKIGAVPHDVRAGDGESLLSGPPQL